MTTIKNEQYRLFILFVSFMAFICLIVIPKLGFTETRTQAVSVSSCNTSGQECIPASVDLTLSARSTVSVKFATSPTHCSDIKVTFSGAINGSTGFLTAGQSVQISGPREFNEGIHPYTITATGRQGGCNIGYIGSWAGTVTYEISEFDKDSNAGPPDKDCQQ